jgi:hypothetical protein
MPQYLLILGGVTDAKRREQAANYGQIMQKYLDWNGKLERAGVLRGGNKLKDSVGRRVTLAGGKAIDGPYAETKESIGGYYLIEARDLDEATKIAHECPTVTEQGGFAEVREIEEMP